MKSKAELTEVVKLRLGSAEKAKLERLARDNSRTFAGQTRFAIREWLTAQEPSK